MSLRLFDTATREVRDFVPLVPGEVGIYLCGATVQAPPHIGHLRSAVAFDVLAPLARAARAYRVTLVRNVTDIDDKILAKSRRRRRARGGRWAMTNERAFTPAYDALGVLPPTYEPRATGHVPEMVALMERLVDTGHAYVAGDGRRLLRRPLLARVRRAHATSGSRTSAPSDGARPTTRSASEPSGTRATSRCGRRRKPGEPEIGVLADARSAAAAPAGTSSAPRWRGATSATTFDIHGGGLDLRFPHHENEQAQSRAAGLRVRAATGCTTRWVTQCGAKMSKSLGNGLLVTEVLARHRAPRCCATRSTAVQYRSMLEWTRRHPRRGATPRGTASRASSSAPRSGSAPCPTDEVAAAELPAEFVAAMDDDLNVPRGARRRARAPAGGQHARSPAGDLTPRRGRSSCCCARCSTCWGSTRRRRSGRRVGADDRVRARRSTRSSRPS